MPDGNELMVEGTSCECRPPPGGTRGAQCNFPPLVSSQAELIEKDKEKLRSARKILPSGKQTQGRVPESEIGNLTIHLQRLQL